MPDARLAKCRAAYAPRFRKDAFELLGGPSLSPSEHVAAFAEVAALARAASDIRKSGCVESQHWWPPRGKAVRDANDTCACGRHLWSDYVGEGVQ